MAEHEAGADDMGIGLTTLFTLLAIVASGATVVSPGTEVAAWGFAAATTAGLLAVAAAHIYWR